MSRSFLVLIFSFIISALLVETPLLAQDIRPVIPAQNANSNNAQLRVVVVDTTDSAIPTAMVTITPTGGGEPFSLMTDEQGVVTVPSLPVGQVRVRVEFSGFKPAEGTLTLRRGANEQTIRLELAGLADEVTVSTSDLTDTHGNATITTLSDDEIEALPDDPEDLQQVLEQLAGPDGATFVMNGFQGGRLPTKDEIRTIRIRANSFAADLHESGGRPQIEIITRPNATFYSGGITLGYQGDVLNARNAQSLVETPEGTKQLQLQLRGPIVRNKTSFNVNVSGNDRFRSNAIIAVNLFGTQVRVPTESRFVNAGIEHALTSTSTLRFQYQGQGSEGRNQGLTPFDSPERATETETRGDLFRAQLQGIVGTDMLNEFRFELNRRRGETTSVSAAPAIIVPEAFSIGGAGTTRRSLTQTFEVADDFDFTPRRNHRVRIGFLGEGGLYRTFDQTNANGRTTYADVDDFAIDLKLQTTQRFGAYESSFTQYQLGLYVQDDIRINNRLSVGVGLRNEMQSRIDDKLNLMPRIGFTLNPFGNRTSIRGGYGLFYDWYDSSLYDQTLRLNGSNQQDFTVLYEYEGTRDELGNFIPTLDANGKAILLRTIGGPAAGRGPSNRTVASPDLGLPYVHQASLGLQHQLTPNLNVQVTYQHLAGRNQLRGVDINYGQLAFDGANLVRVRPDPTSNIVTEIQSTGRSETNRVTVQTRYQVPNQRGFLQFSYQLANARSNFPGSTSFGEESSDSTSGGSIPLPSDSSNPDLDWGPMNQDIRHQLQLGGMVRLPWQLRLQSQLTVRSAPAYNETTGFDDNKDGVVNDRPAGVGRNSLRGDATWDIRQISISKLFGFGGPRPEGRGGGGVPGQGRGRGGPGGGRPGGFGDGFRGNATSNSRYQIEFTVRAQNPLNRVIRSGYTGNRLSPFFGTATAINQARKITFNSSFRF
ncbi:MAG TPA: TonB-dependent receptor [Vicinamibacterales bacterium]|nr:TonB-dependent receptor [Vicinamibacterales bacterium]